METILPIPRTIIECIQDVLQSQIDLLAKDIAKTLGVSDKILLQELRKDKINIYIFEEINEPDIYNMKCISYQRHTNTIYIPCNEPVIYKKTFCVKHILKPILKENIEHHQCLTKIIINDIHYYIDSNNKLYNLVFDEVGYFNRSKKIVLFNNIWKKPLVVKHK